MPVLPVGPVTATEIRDLQEKARKDFAVDESTSIWLVSWGTDEVVQVEGEVVNGQLYFRRPSQL
jgi:hypothetical protein